GAVTYPCRSARGALANTKQPRSVRPDRERLQWKREHSIRRRENQTARRRSSGILTFAANSRLESVLVSLFPAAKAKNRPSLKISCNVTPIPRLNTRSDRWRHRHPVGRRHRSKPRARTRSRPARPRLRAQRRPRRQRVRLHSGCTNSKGQAEDEAMTQR